SYVTSCCFVSFNDSSTTVFYTLSLHDALPIFPGLRYNSSKNLSLSINAISESSSAAVLSPYVSSRSTDSNPKNSPFTKILVESRSEEHTSELQSRENLVCRLLLEKKKNKEYKK